MNKDINQRQSKPNRVKIIAIMLLFSLVISFFLAILIESRRTIISAEEFRYQMEEAGYVVIQETHESGYVETYLIADYKVFYVRFIYHRTTSCARSTFYHIRKDLATNGDVMAHMEQYHVQQLVFATQF